MIKKNEMLSPFTGLPLVDDQDFSNVIRYREDGAPLRLIRNRIGVDMWVTIDPRDISKEDVVCVWYKEDSKTRNAPCPFCGSYNNEVKGGTEFYVHCEDCGAEGSASDNADDAQAKWNNSIKKIGKGLMFG